MHACMGIKPADEREDCSLVPSLGTRPSKNQKRGSGTSAGVEVYTAPGVKAHFRLTFD